MERELFDVYTAIQNSIPGNFKLFLPLLILSAGIALYGIISWNFYRFLARREIISLNLDKYNTAEHPLATKGLGFLLYTLEYLIIMPIVILLWFSVLSIMMITLAKDYSVLTAMIISGGIIGATRISAYYKEDLAKELAKMFPFTLIILGILTPGFFDLGKTFERFREIPLILDHILYFAMFILVLEFVLRIISLIDNKKEEEE